MSDDKIVISFDQYSKLIEAESILNALYGAGVDNWEGYDYAMEALCYE